MSTYNRCEFVPASVGSALSQTGADVEVIVVDHGSTDQTPSVLQSFGDAISVITLEADPLHRPAVARNAGLRAARGEFVAFLDDDDVWEPTKTFRQVEVLEGRPDVVLVSTDAHKIDTSGVEIGRYLAHTAGAVGECFTELVRDNVVISSSVMVRREPVMSLGGFDERPSLSAVEDYYLWLRLAARFPFAHISEPLVRYRVHPTNLSRAEPLEALRKHRLVLKAALEDPVIRGRGWPVAIGIMRDYFHSALRMARGLR